MGGERGVNEQAGTQNILLHVLTINPAPTQAHALTLRAQLLALVHNSAAFAELSCHVDLKLPELGFLSAPMPIRSLLCSNGAVSPIGEGGSE